MKRPLLSSAGFGSIPFAVEPADNYSRWIADTFRAHVGRHVLEVGVSRKNFTKYLPHIASYTVIERDPDVLAKARQENPHIDYIQADAAAPDFPQVMQEHLQTTLKGRCIDTVLCVNVLEHNVEDEAMAANLLSVLQPNGHLLLWVPAYTAMYNSVDWYAGHYRRYNQYDFIRLFAPEVSTISSIRNVNGIGALGWWFNRVFTQKNIPEKALRQQIGLFNRFVVPVSRIMDFFLQYMLGLSFAVVVKRCPLIPENANDPRNDKVLRQVLDRISPEQLENHPVLRNYLNSCTKK